MMLLYAIKTQLKAIITSSRGFGALNCVFMSSATSLNLEPRVNLSGCRFCGTTPNSTALGPLLKSICQQICYCDMLPFENIPDDTVPVTAYLKELLKLATQDRPLLIFLDSVDELTGSQENISK